MVPQKCDGPCGRTLMIWDCTTFWCRAGEERNDLGKIHLCDDCLPPTKVTVDKLMLLDFKRKALHHSASPAELEEFAAAQRAMKREHDAGFTEPEDGSEARYDKRKAEHPWLKHTAWWFVHNCVAHVLIGILPLKPFFTFHDWTSRKMHGKDA